MNKHYQVMKRCALIFCSCCIMFSLVLLAQIQEQKRQIQTLQHLKKETTEPAQMSEDEQQFLWTYEKKGQAVKELEEGFTALQSYYDKGVYLDSLAIKLDRENESKSCIQRYFKIGKGELEKILGETDASDQLKANFPDAEEWGYLLPAGDGIWVQYDADDPQNALPMGVVIQNPLIDIGYKDARAGMYLYDIKDRYPGSAVDEAGGEQGNVLYIRYADDEFMYYYVAVNDLGDAVIVYIVPNNG